MSESWFSDAARAKQAAAEASDLEATREQLTDTERAILLAPCGCGHTINDHGSLVACWLCEEDGGECSTTFEDLLVERVGVIVAARTEVEA